MSRVVYPSKPIFPSCGAQPEKRIDDGIGSSSSFKIEKGNDKESENNKEGDRK